MLSHHTMPSRRALRSAALVVPLLAASLSRLPAQGTPADYARAAGLRELTRDKVARSRVRPQWIEGTASLWYRVDLGDGAREFVLVDADRGERRPAFDATRLASALAQATGREVDPLRLPFDRIQMGQNLGAVELSAFGKRWRLDLPDHVLHEVADAEPDRETLEPRRRPHPSRRTGPETSLTFVNRTDAAVELFWIASDGERRSYGTVPAGSEREQHTYAGHVWLVADASGRTLAVFEAVEDAAVAVVDAATAARASRRPARDVQRPRFRDASPDGRWRVIAKDHNLFLRALGDGGNEGESESALSIGGTAVDGYSGRVFWAPDSRRLVALRTRKGDERKIHIIESSPRDQLQPKLHTVEYAKPGDAIDVHKPRLFDAESRQEVPLDDALFPNPWSISELRWSPDSRRFTFLYNERGHQVLRVIAVDAASGEARAIVEERSATFVDYAHKEFTHFLDATGELIWMSERDGWNHLYLYDSETGEVKNQITRGEWIVRGVDRVDEEKREIWFRAGGIEPGEDPYHVHYCRIGFDGTGLVRLTRSDGTHSIEYSPDGRFLVDTYSRVDLPPVTELRRVEDGSLVVELERADWSALLETGWKPPERFTAMGRDGTTPIYGVIWRPKTFDPERSYPVIEQIYAGPQGSFVPKSFRPFYSQQELAELGFIVVQIDGMGTSNRSKVFHDVACKNLGDSGFPDRILWIQAAARKYPYMDTSRVGVYGGSAGGQSALRALLAHGDFYDVAAADCGCHDNRMDKIWWNELWMGWPIGPHFEEQSNVTNAHKLRGKLLLTVGELDRNVDPASTMQVVNALVRAGKDFDLLVVPGAGHGAGGSPYGTRRRADFFVRHLLGVEPPDRNRGDAAGSPPAGAAALELASDRARPDAGEASADRSDSAPEGPPHSSSALRDLIERFRADEGNLERFYTIESSPSWRSRLETFYREWLERLGSVDFESLEQDGRVDWLLFKSRLAYELGRLEIESRKAREMEPLLPFAGAVVELEESRRRLDPVDSPRAAALLAEASERLAATRRALEAGLDKSAAADGSDSIRTAPHVAYRAAGATADLRAHLGNWFSFYNSYDPVFTWWVKEPYEALDAALAKHAAFLREKVPGIQAEGSGDIAGDPIGRDAVLIELAREMIPYTPEELIAIGEREMAWCEREMLRASRELGFGDDWKKALEHVKEKHVAPGKQPELIRELAQESVDFLEKHELVTIPPLALETWRMEMMSPERQLVNPFFTGGEVISVSYPTAEMPHDAKLMSMRGNNVHFSRATVHHELIPGHHLQGYMNARYRPYRRLFRTAFWIEGWAVYWEMLLYDMGFPRGPEDRIGMLFWRMHRCARILFSLNFHMGNWSPQECIDYLIARVGHEPANAEGEVRRSVQGGYGPLYQCAYLLGALQIRELRRELVETGKMSDRAFHDAVLRENAIPIELVRAALLGAPLAPDFTARWKFYGTAPDGSALESPGPKRPRAF